MYQINQSYTPNNEGQEITQGLPGQDEKRIAVQGGEPGKKPKKSNKFICWVKSHKGLVIFLIILILVIVGVAIFFIFFNGRTSEERRDQVSEPVRYYSVLSGEEITNPSLNRSPVYCVQVPNGMDGARPQVGLTQAPMVFEAIAEAGITRFAVVFQNPSSSVIGPIRSLRQYYLEWDTPLDCTIVHAGGSDEAIASVRAGGYSDLTESYDYMWRDYSAYRAPNNLFTSTDLLKKFSDTTGKTESAPKAFPRMKPEEAEAKRLAAIAAANPKPAEGTGGENPEAASSENSASSEAETPKAVPLVSNIALNFGGQPGFNTVYAYDQENNNYKRAYANGDTHLTYTCPSGLVEAAPKKDCGEATQVAPKVVVAMMVDQSIDSDGYHQRIKMVGSGKAYIFQNGTAVEGTWSKGAVGEQIEFKDGEGNTISFVPGQLWVAAIPNGTGSVKY